MPDVRNYSVRLLPLVLFLCLSALLLPSPPASAAPDTAADGDAAGMVLSVTPEAWAEADGKRAALVLKAPVSARESVVTGPTGKAQILFQDDSTVAVAPDSRVDIRDFVFTPTQSRFELGLNNGLVRVVSGEIVRRNPAAFGIRTPEAHVGVRGTTFSVSSAQGRTTAVLLETSGAGLEATNLATGRTSRLSQVGYALEISSGQTLQRPATPAEMASARQAARANTPVGLATAPAAPLDFSAKGGKSPAGPADKDPLLAENVPAAPLAGPGGLGLNVNDINGTFATGGSTSWNADEGKLWNAGFSVSLGTAAISNASLNVFEPNSSPIFNGAGGTGSINADGSFSVGGIINDALDTTATMSGQFSSINGGNLSWEARNDDGSTAATGSGAFSK
ncbi:FecR domain-containing protein [uncultured Desulfovibrio sp.]|uniref:FecR family protein n=1 Tax=uncultured Desulfovibrio sp. TaxID=167968 RepID=UPI002672EFFA|nr:FecR domain-containing protein [uncultured Desulfovibrio sp.]